MLGRYGLEIRYLQQSDYHPQVSHAGGDPLQHHPELVDKCGLALVRGSRCDEQCGIQYRTSNLADREPQLGVG